VQLDASQINRLLPIKQAAEKKLITLPGVTGVDVGFKEVGGQPTPVYAILVFVKKKGRYKPKDEIPKQIAGVPTDVIEATFTHRTAAVAAEPAIDTKRYDPVQGGSCIAPARFNNYYGSLGMLVKDNKSGGQLWLSAYHVLCKDESWSNPGVDRRITQPAIVEGGNANADSIGDVLRGVYGQVDVPWGYDLYVDCAVCSVTGRTPSSNIVGIGTPKGPRNATLNDLVRKYGATTLSTTGVVASTNFTANIGGVWFYYQYRVAPPFPGSPAFAQPGDSGAAVIDSDFYANGLVIAGSGTASYAVVNPIGQIMEALLVQMP
jgi:hypothetical protein